MRKLALLFGAMLTMSGQQATERFAPLIQALHLTDAQMAKVQPLDGVQQSKLTAIAKVLARYETSAGAVVLGFLNVHDWPTGWPCPLYPIGAYASEFALTAAQVLEFEKLQQDLRQPIWELEWAKQRRHRELLESGASEQSAEVAAVMSDISNLMKQAEAIRPPRDRALAVLNSVQKQRLAAFESDLELAREALELHLIRLPTLPEFQCH